MKFSVSHLVVFSLVILLVSSACDEGWKEFRGNCYGIIPYPEGGTVLESRMECRRLGGDLIAIKTEAHQQFLKELFVDENNMTSVHKDVFIAAGDALTEGYYQWFDQDPVINPKWIQKRLHSEPDNEGPGGIPENCIRIKSGYRTVTGLIEWGRVGLWMTVPCLRLKNPSESILCQKRNVESRDPQRQRMFAMKKHSYFSDHEISTNTVTRQMRCIQLCIADYRCLSFNLDLLSAVDNCVLNNATRWEDQYVMMTTPSGGLDPQDWDYYETIHPAE